MLRTCLQMKYDSIGYYWILAFNFDLIGLEWLWIAIIGCQHVSLPEFTWNGYGWLLEVYLTELVWNDYKWLLVSNICNFKLGTSLWGQLDSIGSYWLLVCDFDWIDLEWLQMAITGY